MEGLIYMFLVRCILLYDVLSCRLCGRVCCFGTEKEGDKKSGSVNNNRLEDAARS